MLLLEALDHAETHGDAKVAHGRHLRQALADGCGQGPGLGQRGIGQHRDEFIAATTGQQVTLTQVALHPFYHLYQGGIAQRMAVVIIDALEVVDVHGDQ
mgnify:CR=1 FL=1